MPEDIVFQSPADAIREIDVLWAREQFREAGVCVVSLVSSPGSGKTAFLEKTLTLLRRGMPVTESLL